MIFYIKQITYLNSFLVFFTLSFSIETINYNFFPIENYNLLHKKYIY